VPSVASLSALPTFLRAAELGNFSAVARELRVSPVAVSKTIATLERNLGVRLFQRSTRAVTLTHEGKTLAERCREPVSSLLSATSELASSAQKASGLVRVTCVSPFARVYLIPALAAFSRLHPQVTVEVALSDRTEDPVTAGYDLHIRAGGAPSPDAVARVLCPLHVVLAAAPSYLAEHGVPRTAADLAAHNCLGLVGGPTRWQLGSDNVEVRGSFQSGLLGLESAALAGLGIIRAPLPMLMPHFRAGALRPVLPSSLTTFGSITLHYRSRKLPLRTRVLAEHIQSRMAHHPDLQDDPKERCQPYWA
jgi:DNA-binding transcriptional LysR family regulator